MENTGEVAVATEEKNTKKESSATETVKETVKTDEAAGPTEPIVETKKSRKKQAVTSFKEETKVIGKVSLKEPQSLPKIDESVDLDQPLKTEVSIHTMLQAGAHFGHRTSRWHPSMANYIYGAKNGIHIIDLPKTVQSWKEARQKIVEVASTGGNVLFVGTKKQAQHTIIEEAKRCGGYYVTKRWLGGILTNLKTIRKSVDRLNKYKEILEVENANIDSGKTSKYTKKERLLMSRECDKLEASLGGIVDMQKPPALIFVIDIRRENIAIAEAKRLNIPVVALIDTNCDIDKVDYPIPSNDDGSRAIKLFSQAVSDAVIEGKRTFRDNLKGASVRQPKEEDAQKSAEEEVTVN